MARVFSDVGIHLEMSWHWDTISQVETARDILSLWSSRDLPLVSRKYVAMLSVWIVTSAPFQLGPQMRTDMTCAYNGRTLLSKTA